MEKDVVGAPELDLIQQAIAVRFGTLMSLASIARTLADHGVQLSHPETLAADVKWRERNLFFTPEELILGNLEAATALIEKIERLREQFEKEKPMLAHLRQSVQQLKSELDIVAKSEKGSHKLLAREVAQWLTVWLQNPQIFQEWLALRRATPEFRESFE
jgi:hypothetical protein